MVLLRKLRQEKGLSIDNLEKLTGIGKVTISNLENKQYKTSNDKLQKLADFFGISDPLELTKNVIGLSKAKKCLNQRCLLNKEKYCQSDQVCEGAFCKSENDVSELLKEVRFNSTQSLFI